ncbi:MAG: hypothetical protein ACR2PT_20870 [Endozoicomonas sp.]
MYGVSARNILIAIILIFPPFSSPAQEKKPLIVFYSALANIRYGSVDLYLNQLRQEGYSTLWLVGKPLPADELLYQLVWTGANGFVLIGDGWEKNCWLPLKAAENLVISQSHIPNMPLSREPENIISTFTDIFLRAKDGLILTLPWISFIPSSNPEIIQQYFRMALEWRTEVEKPPIVKHLKLEQLTPGNWEQFINSTNRSMICSSVNLEKSNDSDKRYRNLGELYFSRLSEHFPRVEHYQMFYYLLQQFSIISCVAMTLCLLDYPDIARWILSSSRLFFVAVFELVSAGITIAEFFNLCRSDHYLPPLYGDGSLPVSPNQMCSPRQTQPSTLNEQSENAH